MKKPFDISKIRGFDWDRGNLEKNKLKHGVEKDESEQVFLNQPLRIFDDEVHSKLEKRYGALGKTNNEKYIVIFFTVRANKIRIISARKQSKKERQVYKQIEKDYKRKK